MHNEYSTETKSNDIALIRVAQKIKFSDLIQPICLPHDELYRIDKRVLVTGWGSETSNSRTVEILRRGVIQIIGKDECIKKNGKVLNITQGMFCAGEKDDDDPERLRTDTCQGDSGGPLFSNDGGKPWKFD